MIDHDPDPGTDPLAGRDPHPRTQIDLWPLHDARQGLLEEIVSQPGAGSTAAPPARPVLLPVGIAAAIALVIGGAWFAVSGDDSGGKDDQVVASTDSSDRASDSATEPSDVSSEPAEPTQPETTPIGELRRGDSLTPQQCRAVRRLHVGPDTQLTVENLETSLEELAYVTRLVPRNGKVQWIKTFRGKGNRFIAIDKDCTVVSAGKGTLRLR